MDNLERYLKAHPSLERRNAAVPIQYNCPKCCDTGWIMVDDGGHGTAKRCKCVAADRINALIKQSELPEEFLNKDFNTFESRNHPRLIVAKNKAVKYVQDFREIENGDQNSILFCGQVGSGKTHLGIAICRHLIGSGIAVMYMPYRNTVTKIKQLVTDEASYDNELDKYKKSTVLYVDDLYKGKLTDADVNIIYELVNYRYMNHLPLIITTEKDLDSLLNFDEAIASRIIEMCRGNIVQFKGKELNYRLIKGGVG